MFRVLISSQPSSKSFTRPMIIGSLFIAAIVAGCANPQQDNLTVGAVPDDYRSRHPIVVSESETVEDIPISANMRKLSFRDHNVVADFASRFRRSGGRSMQIMVPSQSANESAARRISKQILTALLGKGINRSQIAVTSYHASGHSNSAPIRISYLALAANVERCGKWDESIVGNYQNRQYKNFGCATQNNLAKIIANPADLIGPRGETTIDATRRDTVITKWRENGSTDLATQF
ncbi:MAG: pilus assembly protein CpaD [Hyphomicrobiales bacterium]|nr:pilus assembly protein CpaD [Hyphomicrobiales bacterium]